MNTVINDGFMNPDRFGYAVVPFKMEGNKPPPKTVPKWQINRTNSRSMGKATYLHTKPSKCCGSLVRRVYNNECFDCWKGSKNKWTKKSPN